MQASDCRPLTHQGSDHPTHTHTRTHMRARTHARTHTHTCSLSNSPAIECFETFLCLCLPAPSGDLISFLHLPTFSFHDTTPHCARLYQHKTHSYSCRLSLCCYSNLVACSLSPSSLCGCWKERLSMFLHIRDKRGEIVFCALPQ